MTELKLITDRLQFPEGPVAMNDGSVIVVEIRRGTLSRVTPDGTITVVGECGGGPNGAAVGPDGAVYVCNNGGFEWHDLGGMVAPGNQPADYIGGRIQRVVIDGPEAGTVTDLYTECDGHPLKGPNDIVFDAHGGFYFTDLGKTRPRDMDRGGLYYAQPDGSSITEVAYPLMTPNGVGLSPDGDRLYVAETHTGRVWYWGVEAPGVLGVASHAPRGPAGASVLYGFDGFQLLDSLGVDGDGNVCVATLGTGAISVISPDGELLEQVPMPEFDFFVTNICFGGPDLRTAFITSSGRGRLYSADWPRPGLRLNYNA